MTIKSEFKKLKNYYKLKYLGLVVDSGLSFFSNSFSEAGYLHGCDIIIMKSNKATERNLQLLLHEICHALQEKERRLDVPTNHTRRKYALELEAELFAYTEYRKLYGETKRVWDLGDYKSYCDYYLKKEKDDVCYSMTELEIYEFVKNLNGKTKKHILKRLNKKNVKTLLEVSLSKICL